MQRAVFVGYNSSIIKSALRLRRIAPAIEVNIIDDPVYAAASLDEALDMIAAGRTEVEGLPTSAWLENLGIKVIKAEIDGMDLAASRLLIEGEHGTLRLPYNFTIINAQAGTLAPQGLEPGENVFLWPDEAGPKRLVEYLEYHRTAVCAVAGTGPLTVALVGALLTAGRRVVWLKTEAGDSLTGCLDSDMARIAETFVQSSEALTIHEDCRLGAVADGTGSTGLAAWCSVLAPGRDIAADCLIWCGPLTAPRGLTRDIGLLKGKSGLLRTGENQRTSIPGVYVLGSGTEGPRKSAKTNGPAFALERRLASGLADIIAGRPPVRVGGLDSVGFAVAPETRVCRCGLGAEEAATAGIETEHAIRAVPGAYGETIVKLIAERTTRRILGGQAIGGADLDAVQSALALAVAKDATVDDLLTLDLGPRSAADALCGAASALANKLFGNIYGITAAELKESKADGANFFLMDVRPEEDYAAGHLPDADTFAATQIKTLCNEVPRFVPLVIYSRVGDHAYNVAAYLRGLGAKDVYVLDGGYLAWPYEIVKK